MEGWSIHCLFLPLSNSNFYQHALHSCGVKDVQCLILKSEKNPSGFDSFVAEGSSKLPEPYFLLFTHEIVFMLKHLCNAVFKERLQIRNLNNCGLLYEKSSSRCVKLSFLGGTDRGVEWDFQPVILLHLVCNLAGLWSDCIERVRLCVLGRSLFLSQCILPAVKLHRPRSRSHRSMTRNSVVGLVMQWPRHTYIRAGFHCLNFTGGNLTTWRFVEWAEKIWQSQAETRLYRVQECWCVFVCLTEDQIPHGFPTIDMGPQLKVVERTRTATMLCAASGNPDPEIYWFKDFLPVDISSSNGRIKQLRSGKAIISVASHTDFC